MCIFHRKLVDKETGKGLSSNDYTDTEKSKLEGIESGATKVTTDTVKNWGFTKNTGTVTNISIKMNGKEIGSVSTSGEVNLGTVITAHQDISGKVNKSELFNLIYPVGAVYISVNNTSPQTLFGGTWESIGSGRVLQGADSSHAGGTTIDAGLPNITGTFDANDMSSSSIGSRDTTPHFDGKWDDVIVSGALGTVTTSEKHNGDGSSNGYGRAIVLDASKSNPIYGSSNTVQPPAYVVYMWKRTA